jgi:cardiolipin synthase
MRKDIVGTSSRRGRVLRRIHGSAQRVVHVTLGLAVIALALVALVRLTRDPDEHLRIAGDGEIPPAIGAPNFEEIIELFSRTHIAAGNRVEQLLNGDGTYPQLWRDLRGAQHTVTIQMYFAQPGFMSDTLAGILCERALAGVRVLVLLDAFGAVEIPASWIRRLRRDGVEIMRLRKLQWYSMHSAANRSHVRAVVIDGRIGYTGGFGFADYWTGDGHHPRQWRETNVRFEGPTVSALQAAFVAAWAEATGVLLAGESFFPALGDSSSSGGAHAGLLFTEPGAGNTSAERFLGLVVAGARQRLYIANSYFVPNQVFRQLLARAAARGVEVRVLTTGSHTDVRTAWLAGRFYYRELLEHGIRIYEYQPTMMHAKTIVADGVLGTIGSMNFTNRSLSYNNESNLVVLDRPFAASMEAAFLDDLRYSREFTMADIGARPWWERSVEFIAALLTRLM